MEVEANKAPMSGGDQGGLGVGESECGVECEKDKGKGCCGEGEEEKGTGGETEGAEEFNFEKVLLQAEGGEDVDGGNGEEAGA